MTIPKLDDIDRKIVNALQGGFPVSENPFGEVANWLDISRDELMEHIDRMLETGVLSRFGPMFNADRLGGAVTLSALAVPEERFDEVCDLVNAHEEVAHNYKRTHELNMWFVIGAQSREEIDGVIAAIERETGLTVHDFPKQKEFYVGLRLEA